MSMICSTISFNCNGQSCSSSPLFEEDEGMFHMPIAEKAEIGEGNGYDDDSEEEALNMPPKLPRTTSKKMRS